MHPDPSRFDLLSRPPQGGGARWIIPLILVVILVGTFFWTISTRPAHQDKAQQENGQEKSKVIQKPSGQLDETHPPGLGLEKMYTR